MAITRVGLGGARSAYGAFAPKEAQGRDPQRQSRYRPGYNIRMVQRVVIAVLTLWGSVHG